MLIRDHAQDELLQVNSTVFWVPEGNLDCVAEVFVLVHSMNAKAGSISMKQLGIKVNSVHDLQDYGMKMSLNLSISFSHSVPRSLQ